MTGFLFPVDKPYRITTRHGEKLWYTNSHRGIDIASDLPKNQAVRIVAPNDGIVKTSWHYQGGWLVQLSSEVDGKKILHWMAHMKEFAVPNGTRVQRGENIALMGNTGLSRGRHLHWHSYIDGVVVDPLIYVTENLYMQNDIIRNQETGAYAFVKKHEGREVKQPLSYRTMAFANGTLDSVWGAKSVKHRHNVTKEAYNSFPNHWDFFGGETQEFKDKN